MVAQEQNSTRHDWTREEVLAMFNQPFNDLLFDAQVMHRRHFNPNSVQLSTLLSIKTGACPEDCKYCPQSARYDTGLEKEKLLEIETVIEAAKVAKILDNNEFNVQIVLDEKATNTAENFAYLKQWVNQTFTQDNLPDFVITTSDFHQIRAEQIFQGIIPEVTPKWNLSKSSCIHCWSDESIHIKNVSADVMKARLLLM